MNSAPTDDEIGVFPRNLIVGSVSSTTSIMCCAISARSTLIIAGCLTDQCVDSAVRDACDLGLCVS